jgi:hypothetical protein
MEKLQNFSITGIPPFYLDFTTAYPVLAVNIKYTHKAIAGVILNPGGLKTNNLWSGEKRIYIKDTYFLVADKNSRFQWMSLYESSFYVSGLIKSYAEHNKRLTQYSLDKDMGECKNMISPVRPFSITGISMEGFDPEKEYPVLAIDMDQYIPEYPEKEEPEVQEQPQSQSIAFFLVGDDNGEFTWIAEDECRLFPLTT